MTCREVGVGELLGLGLAPRTAYCYARVIERCEEALGVLGVDLVSASPAHIARLGLAWPPSRSSRAQLRAALKHAWRALGRSDPPLAAIRVPPQVRMRCRALDPADAARLEAAAWVREDRAGLAVLIGLYAALRRSEIAGLRWDDLVLDRAGRPVWLRVIGKGGIPGEVPVHPRLADALVAWAPRTGFVFPARSGPGHVNPTTVWLWVGAVGETVGVTVRTHELRHTALAEANDRSGDLRAVQAIARHARPETTAGYTRATGRRMREVVEMIDYRASA